MKTFGQQLAKNLANLVIIAIVIVAIFFGIKFFLPNWFAGTTTVSHDYVITRFERESQLVVTGADVKDTRQKTFSNNILSTWPDWTKPVTKLFISRNLVVEIPIKTEFKLELKNITEKDISLDKNVLSFNQPLTVLVDSQQEGEITILKTSSGLIDKAVDAFTSSKKAQEFLSQESQVAIAEASDHMLNDSERQEKVAQFAQTSLENLLNLGSEQEITVNLTVDDLVFVNQDEK